jgi:hypothetical protein
MFEISDEEKILKNRNYNYNIVSFNNDSKRNYNENSITSRLENHERGRS